MPKAILVTGIAGTGKSSVCNELEKRGLRAFDIEGMEGLFSIIDKRTGKTFKDYNDNDPQKIKYRSWICDKNKLRKMIRMNMGTTTFYCGIASNLFDLMPLFDKVLLLKASPEVIRKRLTERTNNDFGKSPKVQEQILSWKDQWEKEMEEKGTMAVDSNRSLSEMADEIISKM